MFLDPWSVPEQPGPEAGSAQGIAHHEILSCIERVVNKEELLRREQEIMDKLTDYFNEAIKRTKYVENVRDFTAFLFKKIPSKKAISILEGLAKDPSFLTKGEEKKYNAFYRRKIHY